MSDELRERVARAIYGISPAYSWTSDGGDFQVPYEECDGPFLEEAGAAISALESYVATDAGREWLATLGFVPVEEKSKAFHLGWEAAGGIVIEDAAVKEQG